MDLSEPPSGEDLNVTITAAEFASARGKPY